MQENSADINTINSNLRSSVSEGTLQQGASNFLHSKSRENGLMQQNTLMMTGGINLLQQMLPHQHHFSLTSPSISTLDQSREQMSLSTPLTSSIPVQSLHQSNHGSISNVHRQPHSTSMGMVSSQSGINNKFQNGIQSQSYNPIQYQPLHTMQQNSNLISNQHILSNMIQQMLPSQSADSGRTYSTQTMQLEFTHMLQYQIQQQQLKQAQAQSRVQAVNQPYYNGRSGVTNPFSSTENNTVLGDLSVTPNSFTNHLQQLQHVQNLKNQQQVQLLLQHQNLQHVPKSDHLKPIQTVKKPNISKDVSKSHDSSIYVSKANETKTKHPPVAKKRKPPPKTDQRLSKKPLVDDNSINESLKRNQQNSEDRTHLKDSSGILHTTIEKGSPKSSMKKKSSSPKTNITDEEAMRILNSLPWEEQLIYVARAVMGGRPTNGFFKALFKANEIVHNLEQETQKNRTETMRMSGLVQVGNILGHKPLDSTAKFDLLKRNPDAALQIMIEMGHGVDFCEMMSSTIENILLSMESSSTGSAKKSKNEATTDGKAPHNDGSKSKVSFNKK